MDIDQELLARVMKLTGAKAKSEAVEIALRYLIGKNSLYQDVRRLVERPRP